jgi:Icc-related predicted phosphoesterase
MKIVCISDTHGQHERFELPPGDMLLHAGDFTAMGTLRQVRQFTTWLAKQPYRHKVFIAGNHDFLAERNPALFRSLIPLPCHYLENEGIEIEGIQIWGSPITPWFFDWAFNRQRGKEIRSYWEAIPPETDLLVTHGPPYGIRDLNLHGTLTGCEDLNQRIWEVAPRAHVFGHIHEAYGISEVNQIRFINAACLDVSYQPVHQPIVIEI